jgi:hypothetical protein
MIYIYFIRDIKIYIVHSMLLCAVQDTEIHYSSQIELFLKKPHFNFVFYTYLIDVCFP